MTKRQMWQVMFSFASLTSVTFAARVESQGRSPAYGWEARSPAKAYLHMPSRATGTFPALLSETGAFQDTRTLSLDKELLPYDLAVPFWSDGARKSRAVAVGPGKIKFSATG